MDNLSTINGWAARDENNALYAYFDNKPTKGNSMWTSSSSVFYKLPQELLKSIRWEDKEPTQIQLTISKLN